MKDNKNLLKIFKDAVDNNFAIGQFNFSSLEQFHGIVNAGIKTKNPIILGTSSNEADFFGMEEAVSFVRTVRERENIPIFLNFDHGKDLNVLKKAVDLGYDMIHFDGSNLSEEENIDKTREITSYAKERGVVVEGEISFIGGKSVVMDREIKKYSLTSIEKVVRFIEKTEVDCIALDVGNVHGIYKDSPVIFSERINDLLSVISCFVVLHGGSGIKKEDIEKVILEGVVKININTELRLAWRNTLYEELSKNPTEITPYNILSPVKEAVSKKAEEKINLFMEKRKD